MPATDGWHWKEWLAELASTAALMFAVVTAEYWAVQAGPPFSDLEVRIAIVALVAGLAVASLTGKLRHDPAIPCYQRCALPHDEHSRPAGARRNYPIEDPGAAGRPSDLRRAL